MNLVKKSFSIDSHQTSIALEPEFWEVLAIIAQKSNLTLPRLIAQIDENRGSKPLASSLRVFCLLNSKNI